MSEKVWRRKKVNLLLVTGDRLADEAVLAYLKSINRCPENVAFTDNERNEWSGWVVEFEITTFPFMLLSDKGLKLTPFIDDGTDLPRKWKLVEKMK